MKSMIVITVLFSLLCSAPLLIPDDHHVKLDDRHYPMPTPKIPGPRPSMPMPGLSAHRIPQPVYGDLVTYRNVESVIADFEN